MGEEKKIFFCQKQACARATLMPIILGIKFQKKRCIYHACHTCEYTACVIILTVFNFAFKTAG